MSDAINPFIGSLVRPPARGTSKIMKVLASTDPELVTTEDKYVKLVNVYGVKATSASGDTPNTDTVNLGWFADSQPDTLASGAALAYRADPGMQKNLKTLYVRGAVGDGVLLVWDENFIA